MPLRGQHRLSSLLFFGDEKNPAILVFLRVAQAKEDVHGLGPVVGPGELLKKFAAAYRMFSDLDDQASWFPMR